MKKFALVPILLAGFALPAAAGETSPEPGNMAPAKVEITPAPGTDTATAAATVTTQQPKSMSDHSIVDYSDLGGGHGCGRSKTQALIN
jgi:hypothetical protein